MGYAKSARADSQNQGRGNCSVVKKLATFSPKNAEERIHPVLQQAGLALPIEISYITENLLLEGIPRLKVIDLFQYMADMGHVHRLLGGCRLAESQEVLELFWSNYKECYPDFELFSLDDVCFRDCIPVYCHADGGRGYKKSEYMVFNWSAALGHGTGKQNPKDHGPRPFRRKTSSKKAMYVNLLGHSYSTHYLWGVLSAKIHKNEVTFQEMLGQFGIDMRECFEKGVHVQGRTLRLVLLGSKGDLKLQARAGRLSRWYSTTRKAAENPKRKNQTPGHCCWLCLAGDKKYPFEEIHTFQPSWLKTMEDPTDPWLPGNECELLSHSLRYLKQPAAFYLPDLFHIYLAGFGQDYAASCLVYMLPLCFQSPDGASVEHQIEVLTSVFKAYRKMFKVQTHTMWFTRLLLNFTDATKVYPTGTWSKASDTAKIIKFIHYVCGLWLEDYPHDKILHTIYASSGAIGVSMRALYDSELFVDTW